MSYAVAATDCISLFNLYVTVTFLGNDLLYRQSVGGGGEGACLAEMIQFHQQ